MRRAALLLVLTAALVALFAAPAAAQSGTQPLFLSMYQDVKEWVDNTGAPAALLTLGERLLVVLVIIQFYRGWVGHSAQAMASALVRLGIGAFLLHLVATGVIDDLLESAYTAFGNVGFAVLRSSSGQVTRGLAELLARIHDSVGALLGGAIGILIPLVAGATILGVFIVWLILLGAFVALYVMIQIFALLILGIAALLAPVSFATIGFDGTARWAWRWVSGILNALVMVLMANLAAGAAMVLVSKVPDTFFQGLVGPVAGGEVAKALVGMIVPALIFFLVPLFGILALMKVETVVAHFTDAFGDMTATMVDLATGALMWRGYRAAFAVGGGGGGPPPSGPPPAATALAPWRGGAPGGTIGPPGGGAYGPAGGASSWYRHTAGAGAGGGGVGAPPTAAPTWQGLMTHDPVPWRGSGWSVAGPSGAPSAQQIATGFERHGTWTRDSAQSTDRRIVLHGIGSVQGETMTLDQGSNSVRATVRDPQGERLRTLHYGNDGQTRWVGLQDRKALMEDWR